jgi:hypothetical protein
MKQQKCCANSHCRRQVLVLRCARQHANILLTIFEEIVTSYTLLEHRIVV